MPAYSEFLDGAAPIGPEQAPQRQALFRTVFAGRSIILPPDLTDEAAEEVIKRLFELSSTGEPIMLFVGGDTSNYSAALRVFDCIRFGSCPVTGVAGSELGTFTTVILQACEPRLAMAESGFALAMIGGWLDATITLTPSLSSMDARTSILRAAERIRERLSILGDILAARSNLTAADWTARITTGRGVGVDEALRIGLIDAIID